MKQVLYLILTGAFLGMSSCSKTTIQTTPETTRVTVIDDHTDPRILRILADPIISLYQFPDMPDQEAYFRFTTISDRRLNPSVEYHLSSGLVSEKQNKFDDPDYREKLITVFYSKIRETFVNYHRQFDSASSLDYSECYRTIASELLRLMKSTATKKYLVIHSDLLEKSDFFDCYSPCGFQLMQTNPQQIADTFFRIQQIPNELSGVIVIFVFSARTRDEEKQFLLMVEVYKRLLEPRHAKVIVQANNNYFNTN